MRDPLRKAPGAAFGRTASGPSQIRDLRPAKGSRDGQNEKRLKGE